MEVKNIKIDELKAYEHNPRNIGQNAIDAVAHSIEDFGFQQPIVVDQDKVIIVGHTRLLAAKQLGLKWKTTALKVATLEMTLTLMIIQSPKATKLWWNAQVVMLSFLKLI